MSMAGKRSTTRALRQPPGAGFGRSLLGDGARRVRREELEETVAPPPELGAQLAPERRAVAQVDAARVSRHAVHPELIMQVRPAREAGRADVADGLAPLDARAHPDSPGEPSQVSIARGDAVPMPELDQVSVAAGTA